MLGQGDSGRGPQPLTVEGRLVRYVRMGKRVTQRQKDKFASDLKAWRHRRRFTQAEAAEFLGVPSIRTLQNWEIGRTSPVGVALSMIRKAIVGTSTRASSVALDG